MAEELLSSVLSALPGRNGTDDERAKIQQWICMKQECQECVADAICGDQTTAGAVNPVKPPPSLPSAQPSDDGSRRGSKAFQCLQNLSIISELLVMARDEVGLLDALRVGCCYHRLDETMQIDKLKTWGDILV